MMSLQLARFGLALSCIALGCGAPLPSRAQDGAGAAEPGRSAGRSASTAVAVPRLEWNWRLAGVVVSPDKRQALFMRAGESGTLERLTVEAGQQIDGWTLVEIRPDGVTLKTRDREQSLGLQYQTVAERVLAAQHQQTADTERGAALLATATAAMMANRRPPARDETNRRSSGLARPP